MTCSGRRRVSRAGGCPTIRAGIVSATAVQNNGTIEAIATPNDHFTASPHCRVLLPCGGRIGQVRGCPTICAGIVSPAGARIFSTFSTPDDHFSATPDCRVMESGSGCVGHAGGCPRIRAGIVSPAGVKRSGVIPSSPNDHFTAGPDCRVIASGFGRVGRAGRCPSIRAGIVSGASVCRLADVVSISSPRQSFHFQSRPPCD